MQTKKVIVLETNETLVREMREGGRLELRGA